MRLTALSIVLTLAPLPVASRVTAQTPAELSPADGNAVADRRALSLPPEPYDYSTIELPVHVVSAADRFDNTPRDNPITDHGATLGRVLFYDKTLSANGSTSCASCHMQRFAFTDDRQLSVGFDGGKVRRNSMSLVNLRYYARDRFFWDERADSLEAQVLMPIENDVEMGHHIPALVRQLQADPLYPPFFQSAFGDSKVTRERIAKAIAQFVRSMVSFGSRYDIGRSQVASVFDSFPNLSDQENYGKEQFFGRAKCAECHLPDDRGGAARDRQSAFFHLQKPTVNGIDNNVADVDRGVAEQTGITADNGKFKAPSLRNIDLTAPYMHDGRFITLDQVIEHYNWSVRPHDNLDPLLADFAANGLALPEVEKAALMSFLLTLTDHQFTSDPKFSDPFVRSHGRQPSGREF